MVSLRRIAYTPDELKLKIVDYWEQLGDRSSLNNGTRFLPGIRVATIVLRLRKEAGIYLHNKTRATFYRSFLRVKC